MTAGLARIARGELAVAPGRETAPHDAQRYVDELIYGHYNSDFFGKATDTFAVGLIPFIQSNETGKTAAGLAVYNHSGNNMAINGVMINNQPQSFSAPVIPKDSIGIIDTHQTILSQGDVSLQINYSVFYTTANGKSTIYAAGSITYKGPFGP